jgi:succinate-semialdehyde dehydrogenase/glutarate-semialdehyde dehydrogenase
VTSSTHPPYRTLNPATGEAGRTRAFISDSDLAEAICIADDTGRGWSRKSSSGERASLLAEIGRLHSERRDLLAGVISQETGKPQAQAIGEIDFAAQIYAYYAENTEELLRDEPIQLRHGHGSAVLRRAPLGTVLGIMPWNFPFYQVARFAAPNLVIGNPMLLKHAPQCPGSAEQIERIFHDAGCAQGVYRNIYASHSQVATVIADPRVHGVALTGSERAGSAVAEVAGRHLKKTVLELGGSDPFLLLSTDDLPAVVDAAVSARLDNAGQACNSAKRFIVIDELYDEFVERLVAAFALIHPGDPRNEDTVMGPLSSAGAAARLRCQIDRAVANGARIAGGGGNDGVWFEPTVLTDVAPSNEAYREEFFGPVAQVYRASSEDEAVRVANDTPFGLGSYVFSTDPAQARRVAERLEAGMVFVNIVGGGGVELPFGGVKRSGIGRELGRLGADEFVNKQLIRMG